MDTDHLTPVIPLPQYHQPQARQRSVKLQVSGVQASDGAGVSLTRIIGTAALPMLDPFLLLDMFYSDRPAEYLAGFPDHPHRGFETVTYLVAGSVRHADNQGHKGVIQAGGVQWMTAGRGIIHSEMPEQTDGLLWGFQLWINLPATQKMTVPCYQDFTAAEIPVEHWNNGTQIRVIAGTTRQGITGPTQARFTAPYYWDVTMLAKSQWMDSLPSTHHALIFVYNGEINVVGGSSQPQRVMAGSLAVLSEGDSIQIETDSQPSQFLLIAGQPLHEPIAHGGPFVMNTRAEVLQAYQDYVSGCF